MTARKSAAGAGAVSLAIIVLLPGCGTYQKTLAAVGGAGCAAIGSSIGGRSTSDLQRVAQGLVGGGTCAAIGGAIGKMLDERDEERANAARYAALSRPLPASYYRQASYSSRAYSPPPQRRASASSGGGFQLPAFLGGKSSEPEPQTQPAPAATPPASTRSGGRLPNVPRAESEQWVSDHSGASGSVTVIEAERSADGGGECRTLRETVSATSGSRPVTQDTKLCESAAGANDWKEI